MTLSFEEAPMRYLMLACVDPGAEQYVPEEDNIGEWADEMARRNVRILGHGLKGLEDAHSPRRRSGSPASTFFAALVMTTNSASS